MSNTGVKLSTWGTHIGAGNGILNYADKEMFGGNVGHASLSVTFPANDQTKEWIRKYCINPDIPFEKQTVAVDQSLPENKGKEKEEVYVVHFSWFPGNENEKYTLSPNQINDAASEHAGVGVEWNPKFQDIFQPEQRIHKGKLGESLMTYGVNNIAHERNLNAEQKEYLYLNNQDLLLSNHGESLKVALESIQSNNDQLPKKAVLILNRLVPGWKEDCQFEGEKPMAADSFQKLEAKVKEAQASKFKEREVINDRIATLEETTFGSPTDKVSSLSRRIEKKEDELEKVQNLIKANPTSEVHHRSALLIEREIKQLQDRVSDIKQTDSYKHDHIHKVEIKDWDRVLESLNKLTQESVGNDSNRLDIPHELRVDLDHSFAHLVDDGLISYKKNQQKNETHWHNNHVKSNNGEFNSLTKEEAVALQDFAKVQILNLKMKALNIQPTVDNVTKSGFENYVSSGKTADNELHLPGVLDKNDPSKRGLNIESMLKEMHAITLDNKRFNLKNNNCSVTVGRILEAGSDGAHLKSIFQDRALGTIGNPQMVLNNALKYQDSYGNPKDSLLKKISRNNPVEKAGGWCVKILSDKNKSPLKKIAAGLAIAPIAVAAGAIATVKKAANPLKSFKELRNFVSYANTKPSTGFKVAVTAVSVPAFALLAIPAGIQKGVKSVSKGISNTYKKYVSKTFDQTIQEKNVDLQDKDLSKGLSFESDLNQKLKSTVVEVNGNTVKEVMDNFKKALVENKGPVVLDAKTEKSFNKALKKIKDPKSRELISQQYDALCQVSLQRIVNIQKQELIDQGIVRSGDQKKVDGDPLELVTQAPSEKVVLVKEARFEEKEQFYSVMPLLGDELAQQVESYSMYNEARSQLTDEQKALGLPRSVNPEDVKSHDGYLVSEAEREVIIGMFKQDSALQEIKQGTPFPEGHPMEGQTLSCDAFRDSHGAVYVMNPMILGQGGFGTVKVIQAIDTPENGSQVKEKEFYVVKIQNVDNSDVDHSLDTIRKEMGFNEDFGMHFGDMVINHQVMVSAPKYKLVSENEPALVQSTNDNESNEPSLINPEPDQDGFSTFVVNNDTMVVKHDDEEPSFSTMVVKHDDEVPSFSTMVVKHDDEEPSFSTMVVKHDDEVPSFSTMVVKHDDEEPSVSTRVVTNEPKNEANHTVPQFLRADLKIETAEEIAARYEAQENNSRTPTLEQLTLQQKPPAQVVSQSDLSEFDLQKYLVLFEKMAAAVEKVHDKGVLHRDIKAENFLYDAEKGDLRLIDFGCSKRMNDPSLTSPYDMCVGTAHNFSPEHFHQDFKEKISTKQDMYALGRTCGLLMCNDLNKYNRSAFREDIPTPAVPDYLKEDISTHFLENFRFDNASNDPRVDSVNQMMQLLSEMTDLDVSKRPEASEVKMRLQAISQENKLNAKADAVSPSVTQQEVIAEQKVETPIVSTESAPLAHPKQSLESLLQKGGPFEQEPGLQLDSEPKPVVGLFNGYRNGSSLKELAQDTSLDDAQKVQACIDTLLQDMGMNSYKDLKDCIVNPHLLANRKLPDYVSMDPGPDRLPALEKAAVLNDNKLKYAKMVDYVVKDLQGKLEHNAESPHSKISITSNIVDDLSKQLSHILDEGKDNPLKSLASELPQKVVAKGSLESKGEEVDDVRRASLK